jgi:hypothetical protein
MQHYINNLNESENEVRDNIYATKFNNVYYITITNQTTKILIKHAILSLGLKWTYESYGSSKGYIRISWDHWPVD